MYSLYAIAIIKYVWIRIVKMNIQTGYMIEFMNLSSGQTCQKSLNRSAIKNLKGKLRPYLQVI